MGRGGVHSAECKILLKLTLVFDGCERLGLEALWKGPTGNVNVPVQGGRGVGGMRDGRCLTVKTGY